MRYLGNFSPRSILALKEFIEEGDNNEHFVLCDHGMPASYENPYYDPTGQDLVSIAVWDETKEDIVDRFWDWLGNETDF